MPDRADHQHRTVVIDRDAYRTALLRRAGPAARRVALVGYVLCAVGLGVIGVAVATVFAAAPGDRALGSVEVFDLPLVAAGLATFGVGFALVAGALVAAARRGRSGPDR